MEDAIPRRLDIEDFGEIPKDIFFHPGAEIERQFLPEETKCGTKTRPVYVSKLLTLGAQFYMFAYKKMIEMDSRSFFHLQADSVLDVVVVEAYDPSKFWFYLGTSEKTCPLDTLMNDIQSFYEQPKIKSEYAVPPTLIRKDMYLVQIWYGEYHRAKVLERFDEDPNTIRVYFIDYGTVARTPIKGVLFLHQKFAKLPAQAIRCRLSNVVPVNKGHPWSTEASNYFREWVNGRDTKIKITFIDWDDEYVCAFLADVSNHKKVTYINEVMVKEGLAVWEGEEQKVPFFLPNYKSKVQNLHFFPTFLELECGMAPNVADMQYLESLQVPINFCLAQYFEWLDDLESEEEEELESHCNLFVETVKNSRKCLPWNLPFVKEEKAEVDFSIFGELEDEIRDLVAQEQDNTQEYEYHKQEHPVEEGDTGLREENPYSCEEERELYTKYGNDMKSYSESILKDLECDVTEGIFEEKQHDCDSPNQDYLDDRYSQSEIVESELSMLIDERSDEFLSIFGDDKDTVYEDDDINIFDNPELFEGDRQNDSDDLTGDTFLRRVQSLAISIGDSFTESGSSPYLENPFSLSSKSHSEVSAKSKSKESSLKSHFAQYSSEKKKSGYDSDSSDSSLESFITMAMGLRRQARLLSSVKRSALDDCSDSQPSNSRNSNSISVSSVAKEGPPFDLPNLEELSPEIAISMNPTNPFISFLVKDKSASDTKNNDSEGFITRCSPDTTEVTKTTQDPGNDTTEPELNHSPNGDPPKPKESPEPRQLKPFNFTVESREFEPFKFKAPHRPPRLAAPESPTTTTVSNNNMPAMTHQQAPSIASSLSSRSSIPSTCSTPNASSTPSILPPQGPSNFFEAPRIPTPPSGVGVPPQNQGYGPPQNQGFNLPQNQGFGMPQNQGFNLPQNQAFGMPQTMGCGPTYPYPQWSDASGFHPPMSQYGPWSSGHVAPSAAPFGRELAGNQQQPNLKPPPGFAPKTAAQFNPNAPVFNPTLNQQRFQTQPNPAANMIPFVPSNFHNPYNMNYQNYHHQQHQQQAFLNNYMTQQRFMQYQQNAMFFQGQKLQVPPVRPVVAPQGTDFYERHNQSLLKGNGSVPSDSSNSGN